MAKYIAYKESGNLLNNAIVKCINEGVITVTTTLTGTNYTTPVATNTTNITFEGAYLGLTNVINNTQKTGTIVLGVSSVAGGLQSFQYPLSTLTNAISSDKVDRTVISTTTVNNARSFYFTFPSPVSASSNYCLFYRVSATATSIAPTYYGIVGNTNVPANLLATNTVLLSSDEIIITPHIKTDGSYIAPVINGSSNLSLSCFYFTIERDSTFNLLESPYTITIKRSGRLSIIDGGTLNLSAQLPNRGQILMEGDASISLNGGNLIANAAYVAPSASLLTSTVANTANFKVTNANDIKDWSTNDSLLFIPQKAESDFRPLYKVSSKNNDTLTINTTTSAYNLNNRLTDINYDILNLDSNILISSNNENEIQETIYNKNENVNLYKSDIPRCINIFGTSNLNSKNITFKNLGYLNTTKTDSIITNISWQNNIIHTYGTAYNNSNYLENKSITQIINPNLHFSSVSNVNNDRTLSMNVYFKSYAGGVGASIVDNQQCTFGVTADGRPYFYQFVKKAYIQRSLNGNTCTAPSSLPDVKQESLTSTSQVPLNKWCNVKFSFTKISGENRFTISMSIDGVSAGSLTVANYHVCCRNSYVSHCNNYSNYVIIPSTTNNVTLYSARNCLLGVVEYGGYKFNNTTDYSHKTISILNTNNFTQPNINLDFCKFISTGNIHTQIINSNTNVKNISIKNSILLNCVSDFIKNKTDNSSLSSIIFENNIFLNSKLNLTDINDGKLSFKNNTFILSKNFPKCSVDGIQQVLTRCADQEGLLTTSKIYSCRDNVGISYSPINKENNTIVLSGLKINNDIPSSNYKSIVVNKATGVTYTNPVSVTMVDCDITGSAELNVCNGLIDLKNSIIRQKNTGENTLTLTLSNQNTLINVDNLTCFRNTIANNYGLYIKNENIEFSKPPKITIKNSRIDGGISYDGSSGMVKNILYNLPVNKDTYSINIFNNNINNFNTNAINLVNLWPTQVVNISSVNATRTSITDLPAAINATHRATNALAGKTTYPFNINIRNCNLEGGISLNYNNALEDLLDSKTNPFSRNEVSATSFQNILSTNITKTNTGITLTDLYNPRIYTIIDSLSFTPIAAGANFLKTTLGAAKNTLNPYKLDITNSILTGGALTLDNFYGNITNNIVSLSTFDNPMSFGDGPVSIKNNKALVSNLSTGDFIKPDSSCNYSYNINSNYNYCKVELKSVSSFRVDIPNPNTDSIYQESNWVGSRFGLTLASQATAFNYQTRSVSSSNIILSSGIDKSTAFATFSLNSKVNFLRFKATSPVNIYAKMFLNEKMVYCGNLISYPFFIINMREFEWNKKDTFHFVMYFTAANTSIILSDFSSSDNGAEFIPFSISDIGFYNKISHDLITKFKTIHPRKNNRGNYTNLFVDETIESPSYDVDTKLPSVANQPLNQNVIKTGANISLGKIDSKYITSGTTLANIFDATKQQYQYFYNGDMTLYNDDKLISADYDGYLVDTGAPSERVVPRAYLNGKFDHPHRTKSSPKYVALNAGDYAKVFVFVAKTNAYSLNPINAPRLVVAKNVALGIKEDTILDQFTDDMMIDKNYTDWVLLQGSTPAVTNDGVLEFYVDCCGDNVNGTGYINVDSWSASTDNNIGEYWFSDEGETDWNAV